MVIDHYRCPSNHVLVHHTHYGWLRCNEGKGSSKNAIIMQAVKYKSTSYSIWHTINIMLIMCNRVIFQRDYNISPCWSFSAASNIVHFRSYLNAQQQVQETCSTACVKMQLPIISLERREGNSWLHSILILSFLHGSYKCGHIKWHRACGAGSVYTFLDVG